MLVEKVGVLSSKVAILVDVEPGLITNIFMLFNISRYGVATMGSFVHRAQCSGYGQTVVFGLRSVGA